MPLLTATVYLDVTPTNTHADAISYLSTEGILTGYNDGTFRPTRALNRAELLYLAVRAVELEEDGKRCIQNFRKNYGNGALLFRDVPHGAWYESALCTALSHRIIRGYVDQNFRPGQLVNFVDAAAVLARAFYLPIEEAGSSEWYEPYVKALAEKNAIPLDVRSVELPVNRGIVAEITYRLLSPQIPKPSLSYGLIASGEPLHAAAGSDMIMEMLDAVNAERAKYGLPPFSENTLLDDAAQGHAEELYKSGNLSHDSADGRSVEDRIREAGYLSVDPETCGCRRWTYRYGEVIADQRDNVADVIAAFLNSPPHREVMLSNAFEEAGVGRAGDVWVMDVGSIIFLK